MPFCPSCESEYRAGFTRCTDCGTELVDELPRGEEEPDTSPGEPVPFQTFKSSAEAEMACELLKRNGIRSFVQGGEFAVIPGSFSQEVVLMVDERDLTRAAEIYEAFFNAEPAPPDNDSQER